MVGTPRTGQDLDTWPIVEAMVSALHKEPSLYGAAVTSARPVRVVGGLDEDRVRVAVEAAL